MFEGILPAAVAVAAMREDAPVDDLFPEEAEIIARAVPTRQAEFATGRACARAALAELGIEPQSIPSGEKGAPLWPEGIVGSITHCRGYRAAAVARGTELVALGIDAEPDEALPTGLLPTIALPAEREAVGALLLAEPAVSWDRLLFCIKESVYKTWFPLTERGLGFEDAAVTIDRARGRFSARLLVPGPTVGGRQAGAFEGRWLAQGGLLLAAIALPA